MKIAVSRALLLSGYLGMIAFVMTWIIWLGKTPPSQISIGLLMFVTPLLLPLRGILHGRDKALVWGSLISLIYMVHGGMVAWNNAQQWAWGVLEMTLSIGFLVAASFNIRWRAEASDAQ